MKKENIAVGLDIGTTKIVAIIGRKNEFGKIEILGLGKTKSVGVARGVVNNITLTTNSIKEAIAIAENVSDYSISNVVVGIAGQHIRSEQRADYITRNNPEAVIDQNDINRLCKQIMDAGKLPGEKIIHVLPQEYKVDGQDDIIEPIGFYGSRLECNFHVVLGQSTSMKVLSRCVEEAGVEMSEMVLEPIASADAVLSDEEKEAGVALIDIGGGTTDLAIFKGGIIRHTAVIPFGGNIITEDIKEGCSIIQAHAEKLKEKFGSAWPGHVKDNEIISIPGLNGRGPKEISKKNLAQIINARVEEIIELVINEIRAYGHEENRKKLIAGIVLTGGGSKLSDIKQLVEFLTGMDTRIGYPNEHLAGNTHEEISSPLYATAVGLLLKGIEINSKSAIKFSDMVETKEDEKIVAPVAPQQTIQPIVVPPVMQPVDNVEEDTEDDFEDDSSNTETKGFKSFINKIKDNLFGE